jgi:hypothetical protein
MIKRLDGPIFGIKDASYTIQFSPCF